MHSLAKAFASAVLVIAGAGNALAGPGLVVTPQRVVLENRERETKLTLANTGDETGAFRLFFVNYRMSESGAFEPVTATGGDLRFAERLVRFSPRQLVLRPGESQVVRLMASRPGDLAPGEYRSHLVFQNVPRKDAPNAVTSGKGRARAAVKSLYGISIPVIVRHKTRAASVEITEVNFFADAASRPVLAVTASRAGDESVYGDLKVTYRAANAKTFAPLAEFNGIAIYTPLERRVFTLPAAKPAPGGTLRVEYGDTERVFAKKEFEVR